MEVSATEAKNRLGQVLEHAQREPVFIEKAGRKHSVVISYERYQKLMAAEAAPQGGDPGRRFYERYKDWVDEQNRLVAEVGVFGEEFRPW
ncbi:type II toxin-antitoxin system Phd/YefM family antitoxin [Rivibacter subsaxonicus]|uniref:Antitoxin n=1 Tax=Rivibacter subsaxonicus TaxID=457575 RepID=A0A4Q7VZX9_9BURK|nr:type II toxin-antitoxin system prevent-host-death family antitoxin [Rivibacter subsaxonicus]RZU02283.1 prevent-host-death family protein [Rivibacter subsaxonicus]